MDFANYLTPGRSPMAGKQTVTYPGLPPHNYYELEAEPSCWLQRNLLWFPFFKDTKPKFILTVTCVKEHTPHQDLHWIIRFENGDIVRGEISVPEMSYGERQQYTIGDCLLGFGGDTILGLLLPDKSYSTLLSFWTLRGEVIMYGAVLALLAGLAGALLSRVLD